MVNFDIIRKECKKSKINYLKAKAKHASGEELTNIKNKYDTYKAVLKILEEKNAD